jgi:RNA polymerase sigma-70 factor, ECF subfamily
VEHEQDDEQADARLVERAQRGDRAAFAALVKRYQQPVGSYLWRLTRDPELALDLTQDTFVRAYRSIGTTPGSLVLRPWLFRIATNLAYDYFRRQRRFARLPIGMFHRPAAQDEPSNIEERELVQRALARLDPRDRAVLLLCAVEQLSYREVAAITGCGPEAVRKQFTRAKERFRRAYIDIVSRPLPQVS